MSLCFWPLLPPPHFRRQLSHFIKLQPNYFLSQFLWHSPSTISAPAGTPAVTTSDTPRPDISGAPEAVDGEVVVAAEVVAVVGSLPEADVSLGNKGTHRIALDGESHPIHSPDVSLALDPDVPISPDVTLGTGPLLEPSILPDVDVPSDPNRLLDPDAAPNAHNNSQYMSSYF